MNRKYFLFGKKKEYPTLSWFENFMSGHITIGPITIFGENAMHWGVDIEMFNGYLCFRLPFRCFNQWWPLYFYFSPDGTPDKATWSLFNNLGKI